MTHTGCDIKRGMIFFLFLMPKAFQTLSLDSLLLSNDVLSNRNKKNTQIVQLHFLGIVSVLRIRHVHWIAGICLLRLA